MEVYHDVARDSVFQCHMERILIFFILDSVIYMGSRDFILIVEMNLALKVYVPLELVRVHIKNSLYKRLTYTLTLSPNI